MSSLFRGSRKVLVGIGIAGCGAAAALILGLNDDRRTAKACSLIDSVREDHFLNDLSARNFHHGKWNSNWDKRDPFMLIGHFPKAPYVTETEQNKFNERLEKAKAKATRHILLVRHGQYNMDGAEDNERRLTQLGREQAELVGIRLRELALPYSRIVQSTMSRATETAQIISKQLPDVPVESCHLLREGAPYPPEPSNSRTPHKEMKYAVQCYEDGPRIESAFRRYFHRAHPSQTTDSYEILVCHANVIRYFVCRALQIPPSAWLRFSLRNCSLTWIYIRPSGSVTVYSVGDVGHIPREKMTTS